MFISVIKNTKYFALAYFMVLLLDVFVKFNYPIFPYRYASKFLIIALLLICLFYNKKNSRDKSYLWVFFALLLFYIGDLLMFNYNNSTRLIFTILCFSLGKIFLCIKFSHKKDFNVLRLIPFAIITFLYVVFLTWYLYKNLESFFTLSVLTFFLTLLMLQFAYLRKDVFKKKSYRYVFTGVLLFVITESIVGIEIFKIALPYIGYIDAIIYGYSLYFITIGIVNEKDSELKKIEEYERKINLS